MSFAAELWGRTPPLEDPMPKPPEGGTTDLVIRQTKIIHELRTELEALKKFTACTRSHPHEAMAQDCELRTEIARLTNELAGLRAAPAVSGDPVVWRYELATAVDFEGVGTGWRWYLTEEKPNVPDGMVRNLTPYTPKPAQEPYATIDLGHGKWEVGAGTNEGLPCIAFGRNGTGNVGDPITTEPRQMSVEETFAVITFANVAGLDVLQDKMDQVREDFFPGTTPQFSATQSTAPAVPSGGVVAWMVYGNYTRQPFGMLSSAEAYMGGLLKSDPDGGYHIRPLYYTTPAPAPAQEPVTLTESERMKCLVDSGCIGTVKMTYVSGRYEITRTSINADKLIESIIKALRAKGGK